MISFDNSEITILIADDSSDNILLLQAYLKKYGYLVKTASNGLETMKVVAEKNPDLILLDINMPEMDGFQVCSLLKESSKTRDIPVIFMTALTDDIDEVKGFELGAVDYIIKPIQFEKVIARVSVHLKIYKLNEALNLKNEELEKEISERKIIEERIAKKNKELIALNDEFKRQAEELILAYTKLKKSEETIKYDLELAKHIQKDILKCNYKDIKNFNFYVRYIPLMKVGGDIYDITEIKPGHIRIFLADATGHGSSAALLTMLIKSEYGKIKRENWNTAKLMEELNVTFCKNYSNNVILFPTIIMDIINNHIYISAAGFNGCTLVKSNGELSSIQATGVVLGVYEDSKYKEKSYPIEKSDKIFLFTDGIQEEFNEKNIEFGIQNVNAILKKGKNKNPGLVLDNLLKQMKNHIGSNEISDDITLIGIEVS